MEWQQLAVGVAVLGAAVYLTRSAWQAWTGGCGLGCGKCATPAAPEPEEKRRIRLL